MQLCRQGHRGEAGGLQRLLVNPRPDGAVGGQDAHGGFPHGPNGGHRLPDHVDERDMQLSLEPVGKVMGGVAGDGQHRAARPLQELGVRQQMLVDGLRLVWGAQDAGGTVGNLRIAPDEHPQVLLVGLGLGAVDDPLVKGIGGLGAHTAQDA